jgi:hypothetical protein
LLRLYLVHTNIFHTKLSPHNTFSMGLIKGGFLRLVQTLLYALCFCCAGIALGMLKFDMTRQYT